MVAKHAVVVTCKNSSVNTGDGIAPAIDDGTVTVERTIAAAITYEIEMRIAIARN